MTLDQILALQKNADALKREKLKFSDVSHNAVSSLIKEFIKKREEILSEKTSIPEYPKDKVREILRRINDAIADEQRDLKRDKSDAGRSASSESSVTQSTNLLSGDDRAGIDVAFLDELKRKLSLLDTDMRSLSSNLANLSASRYMECLIQEESAKDALAIASIFLCIQNPDQESVSLYKSLLITLQDLLKKQENHLRRLHVQLLKPTASQRASSANNSLDTGAEDLEDASESMRGQIRHFLVSIFNCFLLLSILNACRLCYAIKTSETHTGSQYMLPDPEISNIYANPPYVEQLKQRLLLPTSTSKAGQGHKSSDQSVPILSSRSSNGQKAASDRSGSVYAQQSDQSARDGSENHPVLKDVYGPLEKQVKNVIDRLKFIDEDPITICDLTKLSREPKVSCNESPCRDVGICIHISQIAVASIPAFCSALNPESRLYDHFMRLLSEKTTNVTILLLVLFSQSHMFARFLWTDIALRLQQFAHPSVAHTQARFSSSSSPSKHATALSSHHGPHIAQKYVMNTPETMRARVSLFHKATRDVVYSMGYPSTCLGIYSVSIAFVNTWAAQHVHDQLSGELQSVLVKSRISLAHETKLGDDNLIGSRKKTQTSKNSDQERKASASSTLKDTNEKKTSSASQEIPSLQRFRPVLENDVFGFILDCLQVTFHMDESISRYAVIHSNLQEDHSSYDGEQEKSIRDLQHKASTELSALFPSTSVAKKLHLRQSWWYTRILCDSTYKIYDASSESRRIRPDVSHVSLRAVLHQVAGALPFDHPLHSILLHYIGYPPHPSSMLALPVPQIVQVGAQDSSDVLEPRFLSIRWNCFLSELGQFDAQRIQYQYRAYAHAYRLGQEYRLSRIANSVFTSNSCIPRILLESELSLPLPNTANLPAFCQSLLHQEQKNSGSTEYDRKSRTEQASRREGHNNVASSYDCLHCRSNTIPVAAGDAQGLHKGQLSRVQFSPQSTITHPLQLSRECSNPSSFKGLLDFAQILSQRIRFDPDITFYHLPSFTPRVGVSNAGLFSNILANGSGNASPLFRNVFTNKGDAASIEHDIVVSDSTFFDVNDVSECLFLFTQKLLKAPARASRTLFDLPIIQENESPHPEATSRTISDNASSGMEASHNKKRSGPNVSDLHLVNTQIVYAALVLALGPFSNHPFISLRVDKWYDHFVQYAQLLHIVEQLLLQAREFDISSTWPIQISYQERFEWDRCASFSSASSDSSPVAATPTAVLHGWVRPELVSIGTRSAGYFLLPISSASPSNHLGGAFHEGVKDATQEPLPDLALWASDSSESAYRVLVGTLILLLRAVRFGAMAVSGTTPPFLFPCACTTRNGKRTAGNASAPRSRLVFDENSLLHYVQQCEFSYMSLKNSPHMLEDDAKAKGFLDFFLDALAQIAGQETNKQFPSKVAQFIACSVFNS